MSMQEVRSRGVYIVCWSDVRERERPGEYIQHRHSERSARLWGTVILIGRTMVWGLGKALMVVFVC